ncbi:MAG: S41 family peptidase [Bacteroidota bacterium]
MKKSLNCLLVLLLLISHSYAQKSAAQIVPTAELNQMIDSIAILLQKNYISEEIGVKMGDFIKEEYQKGTYNDLTYEKLGKQLSADFVEVSGDIHMSAFYKKQAPTVQKSLLEIKLGDYGESSNYGYVETKITKDNIGYLKIAHFTNWDYFEQAKRAASNAVNTLRHVNALVIDVRDNPGGFEDIVAHFMSHFFEGESFPLQKYVCRYLNYERSIRTTENIQGAQLPDLPIYILVNEHTASAAESLAYMMKHLQRATIIGETTAGAGNGATQFRVSDKFVIQIATWETINLVTKTSWEKVGVKPNVETSSEATLSKGFELARVAAEKYKNQKNMVYQRLLDDMNRAIEQHPVGVSTDSLTHYLIQCQKQNFYNERGINNLGYRLLSNPNKIKTAEAIFQANVLLYPTSANVYDSYAEALALNGKLKEALFNQEQAVALGKANRLSDLPILLKNLEKIKQQLANSR